MTYRLYYGDASIMAVRDPQVDERIQSERFSTEHEALRRARELIDDDLNTVVAIRDGAGNEVSGVRLQFKLGYCCD